MHIYLSVLLLIISISKDIVNLDVLPRRGEIYCSLIYRGRCGYFPLISQSQCTMGKLQWEVGHRIFSLLREKYIWNIWTQIKWEAKLTNLSELFER